MLLEKSADGIEIKKTVADDDRGKGKLGGKKLRSGCCTLHSRQSQETAERVAVCKNPLAKDSTTLKRFISVTSRERLGRAERRAKGPVFEGGRRKIQGTKIRHCSGSREAVKEGMFVHGK